MADRKVTRTGKNNDGDITSLCSDEFWSPRKKADAISDIETKTHSYYVMSGTKRVDIHVVKGTTGKYLRTDPDATSKNNLDDLPDC